MSVTSPRSRAVAGAAPSDAAHTDTPHSDTSDPAAVAEWGYGATRADGAGDGTGDGEDGGAEVGPRRVVISEEIHTMLEEDAGAE